MKITNINGTTEQAHGKGNWLDHWKRFSNMCFPVYCPESSCIEKPEVAAHVQKDDAGDSNWYIVPLCCKHGNETGKSLTICDIALVPASAGG